MGNIRRPVETAIVIALFITSIFFGVIYFLKPFIGFDLDTLKTSLFYLFSTNAQVLAAFLGISFAILYTTLTIFKPSTTSVYSDPVRRLLLSDPILIYSVTTGIISIFLSLLTIIIVNFVDLLLFKLILLLISYIVINLSLVSILLLAYFAFFKSSFYLEPQKLVSIRKGDNILYLISPFNIVTYTEVALLIEASESYYYKFCYSLKFLEYYAKEEEKDQHYLRLFNTIVKDINKSIVDIEKRNEYYCKVAYCAWKSLIDGTINDSVDLFTNDKATQRLFNLCGELIEDSKFLRYFINSIEQEFINSYTTILFVSSWVYVLSNLYLVKKAQELSKYASCSMGTIQLFYDSLFDDTFQSSNKVRDLSNDKVIEIKKDINKTLIHSIINKLTLFDDALHNRIDEDFVSYIYVIFPGKDMSFVDKDYIIKEINSNSVYINGVSASLWLLVFYKLDIHIEKFKFAQNQNTIQISKYIGENFPFDLDFFIYTIQHKYSNRAYNSIIQFIYDKYSSYFKKYAIDIDIVIESYKKRLSNISTIDKHNKIIDELKRRY